MRQMPPTPGRALARVQEGGALSDQVYAPNPSSAFGPEPGADPFRAALFRYIGLALKHKYLMIFMIIAGVLAGFISTVLTTKIYSATTTIKIDRIAPKIVDSKTIRTTEDYYDPQYVTTQLQLLKSRALAARVVTALNLTQGSFLSGKPSAFADMIARFTSADPEATEVDPTTEAKVGGGEDRKFRSAVGAVLGGLRVQPIQMSTLVGITYESPDPEWAQKISIAVSEEFEKFTLDRRFGVSKQAKDFLQERLQDLKVKLDDAQQKVIDYERANNVISVDNKQPFAPTAVQDLQSALSVATAQRVQAEELWRYAQSDLSMSLPQVMSDAVIQGARARFAELEATYKQKLAVLKPAFPEMVALKAQMTQAENQIKAQVGLIKGSLKTQFETAMGQEKALLEQLDKAKAQVTEVRGRTVVYSNLLREVDTAKSLYEGLLQQFKELAVVAEANTNNVSIIDLAERPSLPISPSLRKNIMFALGISLLLTALLIAILEAFDDTFKSAEDIEERLRLPVLGVVPKFVTDSQHSNPVVEVLSDMTSPISEAYRSLRTALQFSTEHGAPRTLLVTSSKPSEGKSTAAISVAANFGQLGYKVLLIDADMRNPSMHRVLMLDNDKGLSSYLSGAAEVSAVISYTHIDGVVAMPTGPLPPNPAELLSGPRMKELLDGVLEAYDMVIVDGPPVMGLADALIIGSMVEGVLFAVEAMKTRRNMVLDALKRLEFARCRILGIVLNKFDARRVGYGYGYGYGSYGHYGYGYGTSGGMFSYGRVNQVKDASEALEHRRHGR